MKKRNKNHSAPFKAKVALAAIKSDKTGAELANEFQVHTTQITQWRKLLKDSIIEIFSARRNKKDKENQELIDQLYKQVGQLTVELDWVKKSLDMTLDQKRLAIDCRHQKISVLRQCELLGMARSSLYYKPCRDTTYNEQLMRLLDEQYIETPFYGVDKMTHWLRCKGHQVNPKRIRSLLRKMGLEAIYPRRKLNLSKPDKAHKIYPYLLRNTTISRVNQVWSTDITYIRMHQGWVYLVAVMD